MVDTQTFHKLRDDLFAKSEKCFAHSRRCTECFHPIFDEEGNPQYVSEACKKGAKLLTAYRKAEDAYFKATA